MIGSEAFHSRRWERGEAKLSHDVVATEAAVALHYNRTPYVVMMATPSHIEELVLGFSLSEGIIARRADLSRLHIRVFKSGIVVNADIPDSRFRELDRKRRNLAGRTGCGLCGVETLAQAVQHPRPVANTFRIAHESLQRAIGGLVEMQPLNAVTGSMHAAAWVTSNGSIPHVREDVGRHNALDKLIGALVGDAIATCAGAAVITSRASYEMIHKAAAVGIQLVCAISAPTTLAIRSAQDAGITLVAFARNGRHTIYTHAERVTATTPLCRDDASDPAHAR